MPLIGRFPWEGPDRAALIWQSRPERVVMGVSFTRFSCHHLQTLEVTLRRQSQLIQASTYPPMAFLSGASRFMKNLLGKWKAYFLSNGRRSVDKKPILSSVELSYDILMAQSLDCRERLLHEYVQWGDFVHCLWFQPRYALICFGWDTIRWVISPPISNSCCYCNLIPSGKQTSGLQVSSRSHIMDELSMLPRVRSFLHVAKPS